MSSTVQKIAGVFSLAVITGAVAVAAINKPTSAADLHVGTDHATIQAAVNAAAPGDRIVIPAGTYDESFTVSGKSSLEIVGQGAVVIRATTNFPQAAGARKGVDIKNSSNITLKNLTVDGVNTPTTSPSWATGIDAVGTPGLVLDGVTVQNFGKNGIAITATNGNFLVTENVTLKDVTVNNAGWAGVAFYGVNQTNGNQLSISGVTLTGNTTISNTQWGIQVGDGSDAVVINSGELKLNDVTFANNTQHLSNDKGTTAYALTGVSVNGQAATASDFISGVDVKIDVASGGTEGVGKENASDDDVPGVPNTATVQN